jgi:hypothetical protein
MAASIDGVSPDMLVAYPDNLVIQAASAHAQTL